MSDPIVIEPPGAANASIVWLHGLGASADDFAGLAEELRLGPNHGLRFVLPNAPVQSVTINGGVSMPSWYDIRGLDIAATEDIDGLVASQAQVAALIESERERGIEPERIVIGGFSQGGALALYAGLRFREKLAGIAALSAYLPCYEQLETEAASANQAAPIFMAHGDADPVLVPELGAQSRDYLSARGYDVTWQSYSMGHEVSAAEIAALRDWLVAVGIG